VNYTFYSPLSVEECRQAIKSLKVKNWTQTVAPISLRRSPEIVQSIQENSFVLSFLARHDYVKERLLLNDPNLSFLGTLLQDKQGTKILGQFETRFLYKLSLVFIIGLASIIFYGLMKVFLFPNSESSNNSLAFVSLFLACAFFWFPQKAMENQEKGLILTLIKKIFKIAS